MKGFMIFMKKKIVRVNEIKVRLSDEELSQLNVLVEQSGLSRESYIRLIVKGLVPRGKPTEEYLEVIRQLRMIGNNINQLAVIAHRTGSVDGLKLKELSSKLKVEIAEIKKIASAPLRIGDE